MKKMLILFSVIIVLVMGSVAAGYVPKRNDIPKRDEIESVEVHIGGKGQEQDDTFYFYEKENILEIIDINKQLLKFKDPMVKTWFLDVSITYNLKNGDSKKAVFKKVRPVDDYFEKVYNSLEYKRQTIELFKINIEDIHKIVLKDSYVDRKKTITVEDKNIIYKAYENSIKTYELYNNDEDYFFIGDIDFYDNDENIIGRGIILREHDPWNNFFDDYKIVQPIKASPDEIKEIIIENDKMDKQIVIDDYDKIDKILDIYYDGYHGTKSSDYSVEIILKNPNMRHWYGSFFKGEIPDFVVESFK